MSTSWVGGLDLGCVNDYSALALVERTPSPAGTVYAVRFLHRWPLGTPYVAPQGGPPGIVEDLRQWLADPAIRQTGKLAVDATGVGLPVVHALRAQGGLPVGLWPVTLTGGHQVTQGDEPTSFNVPKRDIVSVLRLLLQTNRLPIAPALPLAGVLTEELAHFTSRITLAGNETFAADWRDGQNDDVCLSVGLACWLGERFPVWGPGSIGTGGRRPASRWPRGETLGGDLSKPWPPGV